MKVVTIELFGQNPSANARAAIAEADVIIGIDVLSQREFTVFGTPSLESTTDIKKPSAMRVVEVPLDYGRGNLEELVALVRDIKGLNVPDSAN